MGGIVVFQWEKQQMTLLQNRDNWETRLIKAATWDEKKQILAGRCEVSDGTWFGVSKNGRVAFLVDSSLLYNGLGVNDESGFGAELLPINFLKSKSSPKKFADELKLIEKRNHGSYETGLTYDLIVADITSNSMYYICKASADKPVLDIKEVAYGVHTLSSRGLDYKSPKDVSLSGFFNHKIIRLYRGRELPSLKELASRFMYDPDQYVIGDNLSALFVEKMDIHLISDDLGMQRYGTTSTTVCVVKPTKKVVFYERHYEHGAEWTHHDFTFDITA